MMVVQSESYRMISSRLLLWRIVFEVVHDNAQPHMAERCSQLLQDGVNSIDWCNSIFRKSKLS